MKRLIWKELREKRLLMLALLASTGGLILFGDNYTLLNATPSGWVVLSVFAALCLGASAHLSELGGTADFARSRPISWKRMLAAKLIAGAGSVLLAAILALVVFRIMLPARYLAFFNPVDLWPGLKWMLSALGMSYLFGFLCSLIVPSVFGGLATCVLVFLSYIVENTWYQSTHLIPISGWSFTLRMLALALGVLLISRFGITLPVRYRVVRFAALLLAFTAVGIPMNFTVRDLFTPRPNVAAWSLSPSGAYASLLRNEPPVGGKQGHPSAYLVRIANGKRFRLPNPEFGVSGPGMMGQSAAGPTKFWYKNTVAVPGSSVIWIARLDSAGHLRSENIVDGRISSAVLTRQSPEGRYVLCAPKDSKDLLIADLAKMSGRWISVASAASDVWWKSESEIGYIDSHGPRIISISQ